MTIKILRGNPTDEELAAVLVVLYTRAVPAATSPAAHEPLDAWADRARTMPDSGVARPGPGAWRATYWPR